MSPPLPFPSQAPYRIDQVTAAPLAMILLFLLQLGLAVLIDRCGRRRQWTGWWLAAATLVGLLVLGFTLGSWGASDPTVLSHFLADGLERVRGEPFWALVVPLVLRLPYRMAMVHGLVVGGYAAMAILLARHWRCPAWGGWWALLICCNPLLRYFLQNGVSRQALLTLLLVPLMLQAAGLARLSRRGTALATLGATTVHTAFVTSLALALLPRLVLRGSWLDRLLRWLTIYYLELDLRPQPRTLPSLRPRRRRLLPLLMVLLPLLLVAALLAPVSLDKLQQYVHQVAYINVYPIAPAAQQQLLAMALGVVLACWYRRLGPRQLWACDRFRVLLLFALVHGLVQASIAWGWYPQLTSRFADPAALFLLLSWLAWIVHHRCVWVLLPALLVTLNTWLVDRLIASHAIACGRNDEFLCIPDRWPWQVRY